MFNDKSLSAPQFSHRHSVKQESGRAGELMPPWLASVAPGSNDVFFEKLEAVSSSSITTSPHLKRFVWAALTSRPQR